MREIKEVEKSLIGTCLISKDLARKIFLKLTIDDFEEKEIAQAIKSCLDEDKEPTISLVCDMVTGVKEFIWQCVEQPLAIHQIEAHIDFVIDNTKKRLAKEICVESIDILTTTGKSAIELPKMIDKLRDIHFDRNSTNNESISDISKKFYDNVLSAKKTGMSGVPFFGIKELDELLGGAKKGNLIILAARPAMGKSMCAITAAKNMSIDNEYHGYFKSLEMTNTEIYGRLLSTQEKYTLNDFSNGDIDPNDLEIMMGDLNNNLTLSMNDKPGRTIDDIVAEVYSTHEEKPLDYVVVDHGGLVRVDLKGRNLSAAKGDVSKRLKELAKELDIPVLLLWQLSRSVETRGGSKKPILSDMRDTGELEEDADVVIFPYRPEYYDINEDEEGNSLKGKALFIVAKNRGGRIGEVEANFVPQYSLFKGNYDVLPISDFEYQNITADRARIQEQMKDDVPFE